MANDPPYTIEWYIDENDRDVVRDWIDDLTPLQRRAIGVAMYEILQHEGEKVVESEFGKHLGQGLYEFRVRQGPEEILKRSKRLAGDSLFEKLRESVSDAQRRKADAERILLRVFFHPHGDKLLLLVGAYDKGRHPSKKHQQAAIEAARKRLAEWKRSGRSVV